MKHSLSKKSGMIPQSTRCALCCTLVSFLIAASAQAWTATSFSSFQGVERDGSASTTLSGGVFSFIKPPGSNRCEARGAKGIIPAVGHTYTITYQWQINSTTTDNSVFQWHSYGPLSDQIQRYPFVLKCISGQLCVDYCVPDGHRTQRVISRTNISPKTWYSIRIETHVGTSEKTGWTSVWINGVQKVNQYPMRTFDGTSVEPKWGIYGAQSSSIDSQFKNITMN